MSYIVFLLEQHMGFVVARHYFNLLLQNNRLINVVLCIPSSEVVVVSVVSILERQACGNKRSLLPIFLGSFQPITRRYAMFLVTTGFVINIGQDNLVSFPDWPSSFCKVFLTKLNGSNSSLIK